MISQNKYKNIKSTIDGIKFDSKKEADRYSELKLLERSGKIQNLELQKKFLLLPSQRDENGKVIEREVSYYADFAYFDSSAGATNQIVEDVKSPITRKNKDYIIKRKLLLCIYGIRIVEI